MKTLAFTFDDGIHTHHSLVRPLLKKHGLTGTFFVPGIRTLWEKPTVGVPENEGEDLVERALTWPEIKELDEAGFEIGNHTWNHIDFGYGRPVDREEQVYRLEAYFRVMGITLPVTFCYPGYSCSLPAATFLAERGFKFARAGYAGGPSRGPEQRHGIPNHPDNRSKVCYYVPGKTNPMFVGATGVLNDWYNLESFIRDLEGTPDGGVSIFVAHGFARKSRWREFQRMVEYVVDKGHRTINFRDMPV